MVCRQGVAWSCQFQVLEENEVAKETLHIDYATILERFSLGLGWFITGSITSYDVHDISPPEDSKPLPKIPRIDGRKLPSQTVIGLDRGNPRFLGHIWILRALGSCLFPNKSKSSLFQIKATNQAGPQLNETNISTTLANRWLRLVPLVLV